MASHWGDLEVRSETVSGIAALEREQMIKPRPLDIDGPRLYQPSSQHQPPSLKPTASGVTIDPVIKHTIQLSHYANQLRKLILNVQQQYECIKNGETSDLSLNFPEAPPMPVYDGPSLDKSMAGPIPFLYKDLDSVLKMNVVPLDDYHCRQQTRRAVAIIMAHAGIETCPASILETMTDLCSDYITKMTESLRHYRDSEAMSGYSGFTDIINHVYHDVGIGDITKIHQFYQDRIVNQHQHMIRVCEKLKMKYQQVRNPDYRDTSEFKASTMKEEVMSDIQFPVCLNDDSESQNSTQNDLSTLGIDVDDGQGHDETAKWMQIKTEPSSKTGGLDSYDDVSEDNGSPTPDLETVHDSQNTRVGIAVSDVMSHSLPKIPRKQIL